MLYLPELLWAAGKSVPIDVSNLPGSSKEAGRLTVQIYDPALHVVWKKSAGVFSGPSVTHLTLGGFAIPSYFEEHFFFINAALYDS